MKLTATHLHVHSHYSFLDGASSPEALARRAAGLGQPALALTDWNGLYGAVLFSTACQAVGVRPITGAEIALSATPAAGPGGHLTLLCQNAAGYRSLCRLLTAAQLAGAKGHAPVAPEQLAAHTEGLICLSGCRHGAVAAPLLAGDAAAAWRAASWLRELFGANLWIELPRNDRPDDRPLTHQLARLASRLGLGVVASANVHYATTTEGALADALACIRHGTTLEAARHLRPNHRYHLASDDELAARFSDLPEAVTNTAVVASTAQFVLEFQPHTFPSVPLPAGRSADDQLRSLCRAGLTERYARLGAEYWQRAVAQLDRELAVIASLELAAYFLVVHDVVRFAHERGIPCQGRGSAAGSVVAYTLGISRVDPLAHNLLFERFLSLERATTPDIDIDFAHTGREEVIQYIYRTYGEACVGMACTIQTYHARGAVRDLGKVFGFPDATMEELSRRVRRSLDDSLPEAIVAVAGPAALDDARWSAFATLCAALPGTPRHLGIHNGGVVITGPPLGELTPLERATMAGRVVTQWDKDSLETAGLIKLDVLALQGLDLIREAVELTRQHEGIPVDLDSLPLDDPAVFELLRAADTIGCFQVESRAQQQILPLHEPATFSDLANQIAIIRPGPIQAGMVHPYLRRRRGEEEVTYPHPLLEPALRDTLGIILYQEQVLQVATALAGFTLGEGDELRRAMGAKRSTARMQALRERFMAGASERGLAPALAEDIFQQVAAFAGYGFPRSHAVAFARLSYETAWLKAHHPVAFYCARLNAQPGGFYPPGVIIGDARRHGVEIRGPDLERSDYNCTIEPAVPGLAVRLGLRYVRGLAEATGTELVAARAVAGPYRDLADLCRRAHHALTPTAIAALVAAGACDSWQASRRELLWSLPSVWRDATGLPLPVAPVALPEETALERVRSEAWATGLPVSQHVVATQRPALAARGILPLAELMSVADGTTVTVGGRLTLLQRPPTAKGVAFVSLEDETGLGNLVFSPGAFARWRVALHMAPLVIATGVVQRRGSVVNVQVNEVEPWWPV